MSMITCPSCNTTAPPGAIFCDNCGYDLRTVTPSAQQPVPPTFYVPSPAGPAAGNEVFCTACGHANVPGSVFCENCGSKLEPVAAPAQPPAGAPPISPAPQAFPPVEAKPAYQPPAPAYVTGRLVIQSTGTSLPFPPAKQAVVLGREDPVSGIFPDVDLDPHGGHEAGVGRKHAQVIAQAGGIFIEDLDSVNGTVVNRQRIAPKQPYPLKDGDEVRLGKLVLIYHTA